MRQQDLIIQARQKLKEMEKITKNQIGKRKRRNAKNFVAEFFDLIFVNIFI